MTATSQHLRRGETKSCGCFRKEHKPTLSHGYCRTPIYNIWCAMKNRCNNPRDTEYKNYGGRGINVCDRWLHDFPAFLADMGPRPSKHHSIDRKQNSVGYTPDNCRWATPLEQAANKRNTRRITANSHTATVTEWAEMTGLKRGTIADRLQRGWTGEKAVSTPLLTT